jgi:hypothetical protein
MNEMEKDELVEKVAHELWRQFTRSMYSWDYLISTYKKVWYERAAQFIANTGIDNKQK